MKKLSILFIGSLFFIHMGYAQMVEIVKQQTNDLGVFKITFINKQPSSKSLSVSVSSTSAKEGKRAMTESNITVPANETLEIFVIKPFFGDSIKNYQGQGSRLLGNSKVDIFYDGTKHILEFKAKNTEGTLFSYIPDLIHVIE